MFTLPYMTDSLTHSLYKSYNNTVSMSIRHLLIIINIDHGLLPLACWHSALEQDINLTVRSALHLRKTPPGECQTDEGGTTPDVTALATEVAARRVEHVGCNWHVLA